MMEALIKQEDGYFSNIAYKFDRVPSFTSSVPPMASTRIVRKKEVDPLLRKPQACMLCHKEIFWNKRSAHSEIHHKTFRYGCPSCEYNSHAKRDVRRHMEKKHKDGEDDDVIDNMSKEFKAESLRLYDMCFPPTVQSYGIRQDIKMEDDNVVVPGRWKDFMVRTILMDTHQHEETEHGSVSISRDIKIEEVCMRM